MEEPIERTLEDVHRDVEFANRYRLEYIKHIMSIAAGVFVISIAFMGELTGDKIVESKSTLVCGWFLLLLSLVAGIFHMKCWDRFFTSFRKDFAEGSRRRKRINRIRILVETLQIGLFVVGLLCVFLFARANL
jgi:hypothetical protein